MLIENAKDPLKLGTVNLYFRKDLQDQVVDVWSITHWMSMDDDFQVQIASVTCQSFAGLRMEGLVGRTSGLQQEHSPES